jgi:MFS family permease
VPSSVLIGLSLLILLFHPDKQDAFIAAMVFGLGMGAIFPSLQALIISNASPEKRTLAAAAFLNGYDIGIALSTIGLGIISEIFHTYRYVYLVTPIYIVVFLLVYNLSPALLKGKRL